MSVVAYAVAAIAVGAIAALLVAMFNDRRGQHDAEIKWEDGE